MPKQITISNLFALLIFLYTLPAFAGEPIDAETLAKWSAPYRDWHYHPEPIVPSDYMIPGFESFRNFDVPCVYQIEDNPGVWYMSFVGFNKKGYNSFVAESTDLINWSNPRQAMSFGPEGEFDHGGRVIGAYLYNDYDIKAPRTLKKKDGKYWTLFGDYPRQGGYELRPGSEGVAVSDDGIVWQRVKDEAILSVHQPTCKAWEKDCIYQPWLVEHEGTYYNYYNAAEGTYEQLGLALSENMLNWVRYPLNPVVKNRPGGYDEVFASDAKVFRDGDHWTMIYFGVQKGKDRLIGHAHIMIAFSRDLIHWTVDPEPLYKAGGHPEGLDEKHAHKISIVHNPANDTFYLYYCAVENKGRCIGLLTNRKLDDNFPSKDPGIVLTFDDSKNLESWAEHVPLFEKYGAKATFFLDRPDGIDETQQGFINRLRKIGCEMACHGFRHRSAVELFEKNDADALLQEEIFPAVEALKKLGIRPKNFAYPGNRRSEKTDDILKKHFRFLRAGGGGSCNRPLDGVNAIFIPTDEIEKRVCLFGTVFDGAMPEDVRNHVRPGLERAKNHNEIILFYGHKIVDERTGDYQTTATALEELLKNINDLGLRFYTLEDLGR